MTHRGTLGNSFANIPFGTCHGHDDYHNLAQESQQINEAVGMKTHASEFCCPSFQYRKPYSPKHTSWFMDSCLLFFWYMYSLYNMCIYIYTHTHHKHSSSQVFLFCYVNTVSFAKKISDASLRPMVEVFHSMPSKMGHLETLGFVWQPGWAKTSIG